MSNLKEISKLFDIPLKEAEKCIESVHLQYPDLSKDEIISIILSTSKEMTSTSTTTQCLKVGSLRKETGDPEMTLEKWVKDPNNVYVGRHIRIFIGSGSNKRIFHLKGSKFGNPYTLKDYTLEESLRLYDEYLHSSGLINEIKELQGKNLGCFCDQRGDCHAKILASYLS